MLLDEKFLSKIIEIQKSLKLDFLIHFENVKYNLDNVTIIKSSTPLSKPTVRGGVYFSDTFNFKIKATVNDFSIMPLLSKSMLGPNTEFQELKITTSVPVENSQKNVTFFVYLTNSMKSSSYIELNMIVIRTDS
ncbi:MAG TPA: hypothetical protein VH562_06805 [Nitrosopumilaceae archaeon]